MGDTLMQILKWIILPLLCLSNVTYAVIPNPPDLHLSIPTQLGDVYLEQIFFVNKHRSDDSPVEDGTAVFPFRSMEWAIRFVINLEMEDSVLIYAYTWDYDEIREPSRNKLYRVSTEVLVPFLIPDSPYPFSPSLPRVESWDDLTPDSPARWNTNIGEFR
jgi:hypothetical protein